MLPDRNHAVIVQNRTVHEYAAGVRLAEAGGTVAFGGLPTNTDTITIGGSGEAINDTYTFLDSLTGADNEVKIETADRDATMSNLVDAINVNAPTLADAQGKALDNPVQGVAATFVEVGGGDNDTLTLAVSLKGAGGNLTLAESTSGARITVVSLSGGSDLGAANTVTPLIIFKTVTTNIDEGVSVNAEPLVASSTPYITASVFARTGSAGANNESVTNTGDVYILTTDDDLRTGSGPVASGQTINLPDNCDLADFYCAVKVNGEGVIITYTV